VFLLIGQIVTASGVLFLLLGSLGIFRMPDVYNRLQAGTLFSSLLQIQFQAMRLEELQKNAV
jgi:monovalent cation/proton antiporter MnhG/PhaG subunit